MANYVALLIPKTHNISYNTSELCEYFDETYVKVTFICFLFLLMVSGLFVNISLLVLFFQKRHSLSHSNVLRSSLAASNSIACFVVLPKVVQNILSPPLAIGMVCDTFSFLQQLWWISSNYNILFISYDKWKSVVDTYRYSAKMTQRKAVIFISIVWALSTVFAILIPVAGWTFSYNRNHYFYSLNWDDSILLNIVYICFTFWIPGIIIFSFHIRIIQNVIMNSRRLTFPVDAHDTRRYRLNHDRLLRNQIKSSCMGVSIFLFAWLPYSIVISFHKLFAGQVCGILRVSSIMIYIPIVVYPYFFGFRNKKIRDELLRLFSKIHFMKNVGKIHPAPNIDESEYPENVSRRNSRTDSINTEKRLSQSSIFTGIYLRRESGMTNVDI